MASSVDWNATYNLEVPAVEANAVLDITSKISADNTVFAQTLGEQLEDQLAASGSNVPLVATTFTMGSFEQAIEITTTLTSTTATATLTSTTATSNTETSITRTTITETGTTETSVTKTSTSLTTHTTKTLTSTTDARITEPSVTQTSFTGLSTETEASTAGNRMSILGICTVILPLAFSN